MDEIKTGDIFQLGNHRLMCGDSTSSEAVGALLGGEKADLVFTDPPYGMKKEGQGIANDNLNYNDLLEFNRQWIPLSFEALKENGSWYCWGQDEPLMDIYSEILKPMKERNEITFRNLLTWRKENDNPTMLFNGACSSKKRKFYSNEKSLFVMKGVQGFNNNADNYFEEWEPFRQYCETELKKIGTPEHIASILGFKCSVTIRQHWMSKSQWSFPPEKHVLKLRQFAKENGIEVFQDYESVKDKYEQIKNEYDEMRGDFYNSRAYFDGLASQCIDVWAEDVATAEERQWCPTTKPFPVCARAIKSSSREGEIVLDLFGGGGSTLIACERLNRVCYMMELLPESCEKIIKRYEQETGEKAIKLNKLP